MLVYLAQNLLLRRSVLDHLDQEHPDLEVVLPLEVPWALPLKVDLEHVRPLNLSFLTCVATFQFGMSPVPLTGTQYPPYQITSEKEPGQIYSDNFHSITMMPAYRNASFEVLYIPNGQK